MAAQPPEGQDGSRKQSSDATFSDLKKDIAARNEQAHKEARELRAAREREKLGIVARRQVDLDR
jgi:hypothetical protein